MTHPLISKIISAVQDYTNIPVSEDYKSEGDLLIDYFADAEGLTYSEVLIGMKMKGYHYNYEQRQALMEILNVDSNVNWSEIHDDEAKYLLKNKFSEQTVNRLKEAAVERRLNWIISQIESDEVSVEEKVKLIDEQLLEKGLRQANPALEKFLATIANEPSLQNEEKIVEWSEEIEILKEGVWSTYFTLAETEKEKAINLASNDLLTSQNFSRLEAASDFLVRQYEDEFDEQWKNKPYNKECIDGLFKALEDADNKKDQIEAIARFDAMNLLAFSNYRDMPYGVAANIWKDVYERYSDIIDKKNWLESEDPLVKLLVTKSLEEAPIEKSTDNSLFISCLPLTEDPNPFVRRRAFEILSKYPTDLIKRNADNDFYFNNYERDVGLYLAGSIGNGLNDKDSDIRNKSQYLLRQICHSRSDGGFVSDKQSENLILSFIYSSDFGNLIKSMIRSAYGNSCEGEDIYYDCSDIFFVFKTIFERGRLFEYYDYDEYRSYEIDIIRLLLERLKNPNDVINYGDALLLLKNYVNLESINRIDHEKLYNQVRNVQIRGFE